MIPADKIEWLRELSDADAFEAARILHRERGGLHGPFGESIQDHETAQAWIKISNFIESDSLPDAIKRAVAEHPSVAPATLQGIADSVNHSRPIQTLANDINGKSVRRKFTKNMKKKKVTEIPADTATGNSDFDFNHEQPEPMESKNADRPKRSR